MDKKTLNNEIVLCRVAVRKAKVAVIRKIIKKMKILKTCKVEAVKEKKLKKSERLFKKIQIMKRVKVDDVTKFALRHSDLKPFLKGPKVDLQQNALACLAQHDAVMKKINSIREQIPNWETELPYLLGSLGRKKKRKLENKKEFSKTPTQNSESDKEQVKKDRVNQTEKKMKNKGIVQKEKQKPCRRTEVKCETDSGSENSEESVDSDSGTVENLSNGKVEKIVDPFFIGKTVLPPKLVSEGPPQGRNEDKLGELRKSQLKRNIQSSLFHTKPYRSKDSNKLKSQLPTAAPEEEKLHPSWAAKKVKLIKPFQGKKIKFSDD